MRRSLTNEYDSANDRRTVGVIKSVFSGVEHPRSHRLRSRETLGDGVKGERVAVGIAGIGTWISDVNVIPGSPNLEYVSVSMSTLSCSKEL
eukprot:202722-Chlamydomonas_euryale.AAC.2